MSRKSMFCKEYFWQILVTIGGLFVIFLTLLIGAFLVYKGSDTFFKFHHTLQEFLGSANFAPMDNASSKGHVGALIFIVGSLCVCGLALLIATPFALGSSIFMTEISPKFGEKFYRPMVEIFAGIPSVVYGWVGLTVLIPFLKKVFDLQVGHSILAASLVLSIMIFPSITSVFAVILLIVDSVILISFLKQKSKFLRLAGEGNKIYAKIVNISKQNNVNGAPLTIECAYDNNGEVLFFNKKTNKLTNYNILNKKVAVYYNKNNTKDFYIDFNDIINV